MNVEGLKKFLEEHAYWPSIRVEVKLVNGALEFTSGEDGDDDYDCPEILEDFQIELTGKSELEIQGMFWAIQAAGAYCPYLRLLEEDGKEKVIFCQLTTEHYSYEAWTGDKIEELPVLSFEEALAKIRERGNQE